MKTREERIEQLHKDLDMFLGSALTIYDVMKAVPHPYNAVASLSNQWAHDFVGFAFKTKRLMEEQEAEIKALKAKLGA